MKIPIEGPLTVEKEPLNYWVSYNLLHGNYKLFISERRKEMSKDTFQLQDKVVESLFKAYFEEEKSLGEAEVLLECGKRAGIDASKIVQDKRLYRQETINELQMYGRGCRGVPMFIIDEKFSLSGAQDAETLLEVFDEVTSS